jgi:hypothetical protein
MPEIFLAIVHNGELPDSPAQESLRVVLSVAQAMQFKIATHEYVEQGELSDKVDRRALLNLDRRQRDVERRWRISLHQRELLRNIAATVGRFTFWVRVHLSPRFAQNAWRAVQIQSFVTKKHLAALQDFAATEAATFVCLESDVVTLADSKPRFESFLKEFCVGVDVSEAQYWNLAGGRDLRDLGVGHLARRTSNGFTEYDPPVSNTAAQYACNQVFAGQLLAFVNSQPQVCDFGIDWVMNAFFMSGSPLLCLHADPPIFGHGSMLGVTRSWNSSR